MGRTIEELLDRYELYARAAGFSRTQVDHMRRCVGLLDQFLQGIEDIKEVTAADFRRFLADLRDRPLWRGLKTEQARHLSGTSINTYARAVKAFFNWLKAEGIIADNPLAAVPAPRKPKTLPKVYSEKELRAVYAAAAASANIRDEAVFSVLLDSGIRLAEFSALKIGGVDTESGSLKVRGKGNKERFAYLGADGAPCIDRYIKECRQGAAKGDFLFVTKDGQPLQARGVQSLLLRLGKKAGLDERLSAHKLRHSFATLSLKYGGNLEYIRKILGHTDIKTTSEAYLNVQDADVSAAHRRFSPLSNLLRADAAKGFVSPNEGKPADQQKNPEGQPGQQAHEETSSEQMPLRNSKQESPPKLAHDRSTGEHEKTEAGERPDDAEH
jgi:site-specific recombinase XerD